MKLQPHLYTLKFLLVLTIAAQLMFGSPRNQKPTEKLLTDEEIGTETDPLAANVDEATSNWVRQNHRPLRSLTSTNYADLEFLRPLLKGKRIVQLGESSHGVAEFNLAKVRLTKFLHQELGFEVIVFESPFYECYRANQQIGSQPISNIMRNCLLPVWHTREVVPLFEYLGETKHTRQPLNLAGFDVQPRGWGEHGRAEFLRDTVAPVDPKYADEIFKLDQEFDRKTVAGGAAFSAFIEQEGSRLENAYAALYRLLINNERKLKGEARTRSRIARQTVFSTYQFIKHRRAPNRLTSEVRDMGMKSNLDFLLNQLYPDKKIIVWAHNEHIRHNNEANTGNPMGRMGSWLVRDYRTQLYTVGLYAYRGRMANNGRTIYDVTRGKQGSFESILYRTGHKFSFVDFSRQKRTKGNEWIFTSTAMLNLGTNEELLVPKDQYDGVLFIDTVSPPRYGTR